MKNTRPMSLLPARCEEMIRELQQEENGGKAVVPQEALLWIRIQDPAPLRGEERNLRS